MGYPTIRYLRYQNDQNQLVLSCPTSADQICTHLKKSYTHKSFKIMGDPGTRDLKKTLDLKVGVLRASHKIYSLTPNREFYMAEVCGNLAVRPL
jgi:hypothetical protein